LNSIGFLWSVKEHHDWMEMYERLLSYKTKYDTTHVPRYCKKDPLLGRWVDTQRQSCIDGDRIDLLNGVDFDWEGNSNTNANATAIAIAIANAKGTNKFDDKWMNMFERLAAFEEKYNTTCVPRIYKSDPQLGDWVIKQRIQCKDKNHTDLLNSIGFVWNATVGNTGALYHGNWLNSFERLVAYENKYKTTCVPRGYKLDPQLGGWVIKQRQKCKDKDRIDLLNGIGFVWNTSGRKLGRLQHGNWTRMYDRLVAYETKKKLNTGSRYSKPDMQLTGWMNKQRQYCKVRKRIDLLNRLGFVWNVRGIKDTRYDPDMWRENIGMFS